MNDYQFDEYVKALIAEEDIELPESVRERTEQTLASLPLRMPKRKPRIMRTVTSIAACMAILLLGVMPNISTAYAVAVEDIPIIGDLVRVLTIRNYFYEDERHELNAEIPEISDPQNEDAGNLINKDIDELASAVISKFYHELEISSGTGYGSVYIDYETLTNTEQWFTLKLTVSEIKGSSDTSSKYYHIDRTTGSYIIFADLFDEKHYTALEELIMTQMKNQMAQSENITYWIEDSEIGEDFITLNANQNFYFKENGNLVLVYNKYEVGPGSMGCPEFELLPEEYMEYMNPSIAELFGQE